jgi:hypothetical protein
MKNNLGHTFHIPVLGVGYSVDAPVKVAKYGISSVISLVDDSLLEHLRKYYSEKLNLPYKQITSSEEDSRARRTTAYLNMINYIVKEQFEKLKNSAFEEGSEITKYFEMLPEICELKKKYNEMIVSDDTVIKDKLQNWLRENIFPGSIEVNIMTKLDKANYNRDNSQLPIEFNDAHASLRGFALSNLESTIVFSAGMNPKLFSYMESFKDFYPLPDGSFKKKIAIKVSDFRSAFIQGKFLAKKGLWVSEYRIESGLNCGGHAFASDGIVLGPILEEFKNRKNELVNSLKEIFIPSLNKKEYLIDNEKVNFKVTVQGGVGKTEEHEFLRRYYGVESVGWGSPFLLVPEVMNVDPDTLRRLCDAGEDDLYLSNVSPLGVPFNSLRNNTKDIEKMDRIERGRPGSPCTKKFLVSNKNYTEKPICTASIEFMKKISILKNNDATEDKFDEEYEKASEKVCLCEGLSASTLMNYNITEAKQSMAVSICPGPNLAYYSKVSTLRNMIDHIYGRINLITDPERPNMFIKELSLNIDFIEKIIIAGLNSFSAQSEEYANKYYANLLDGLNYYKKIIPDILEETEIVRSKIRESLDMLEQRILLHSLQPV